MKVYITKYALTRGILEAEAETHPAFPSMVSVRSRACDGIGLHFHGEGRDWHRTLDSAQKRARQMRDKKLQTIQKAAEQLSRMRFDAVTPL